MAAPVKPLTIDDFERLPQEAVYQRELVDGELADVSGNTLGHNKLRDLLVSMLLPYVEGHKLGSIVAEQEYDFGGNAYGPDVTFSGSHKSDLHERKLRVQRFVPDLAIEIVSQNDTFEKLIQKADRYRGCGTNEVWIIDADSRRAFRFSGYGDAILSENDTFESPLIPGFSVRLGELFSRL
jgi:Uma2 family endonuclease